MFVARYLACLSCSVVVYHGWNVGKHEVFTLPNSGHVQIWHVCLEDGRSFVDCLKENSSSLSSVKSKFNIRSVYVCVYIFVCVYTRVCKCICGCMCVLHQVVPCLVVPLFLWNNRLFSEFWEDEFEVSEFVFKGLLVILPHRSLSVATQTPPLSFERHCAQAVLP